MEKHFLRQFLIPMIQRNRIFLVQDIAIIVLSVLVAFILVQTDALIKILSRTQELEIIGSFVAGMFFTSIFTTAPAIATLGELAQSGSIWLTALVGALGAVVGDLIIFEFIRDRFGDHLAVLFSHTTYRKRLHTLLRLKYFRWFTFLLGGLVIASPLPDEIGIGILGFSKTKVGWFIPLSFVFNFLGIVIIGFVARGFL